MEQETALLKAATDEARSSKETLEAAYNDLMALQLTVGAALEKIVGSTRAARMAVVGEMRESLQALKDVRQFFLESDYKTEMERLERFVVVCKELVALKKSGALDAVADVAIKLAVGETK